MDGTYSAQSVGVALSLASLFSSGYQVDTTNHISSRWNSSAKSMLLFWKELWSNPSGLSCCDTRHADTNNVNLPEAVVSNFCDC